MDTQKTESLLNVDLVEELGLQNMPLEQRTALLSQMSDVIMKAVWLKVMEQLSESQAMDLEKLFNAGDPNAIVAYLKKEIPSFDEIVAHEVASYKELMLGGQ